jgi:hypothetical protein
MIPTERVALPDNPRTGASRACRYDPDLNLLFDFIAQLRDVTAPLGQAILTTCHFRSESCANGAGKETPRTVDLLVSKL